MNLWSGCVWRGCVVWMLLQAVVGPSLADEYCVEEIFNASCTAQGPNDVIVMTSAFYGRMAGGRCVKMEYGPRGCHDDVTSLLDDECSGRRTCHFPVSRLLGIKPCHLDLTSYLEAAYQCVTVTQSRCSSDVTMTSPTGHVFLPVSHSSTLFSTSGGASCSWLVSLDPRQRIRFSLYAFGPWTGSGGSDAPGSTAGCAGVVLFDESDSAVRDRPGDGSGGQRGAVGGGEGGRVGGREGVRREQVGRSREEAICRTGARPTLLYASQTHRVRVSYKQNAPVTGRYILNYEAVGCPTLKLPSPLAGGSTSELHVTQDESTATVRCNRTGEIWFLSCSGHQWKGELTNCSVPFPDQNTETEVKSLLRGSSLSYGLISAVVIGVLLGVVIGSVPLGIAYFCLRRRWRKQPGATYTHDNVYDSEMHKMVDEEGRPVYALGPPHDGSSPPSYPPYQSSRTPAHYHHSYSLDGAGVHHHSHGGAVAGMQTVIEEPGQHGMDYCTYSGQHCSASHQARAWVPDGPWVGPGDIITAGHQTHNPPDRSPDRGGDSSCCNPSSAPQGARCGGERGDAGSRGCGARGSEHVYETASTGRGTVGGTGECVEGYFHGTPGGAAILHSGAS